MAHFTKLGTGNIVEKVEVVSNDIAITEQAGIDFLKSLYGNDTLWKQTSYNANFRKHFASQNYTYDESRDAFIPPRPFQSWSLNEDTLVWECPKPYPVTFTQNLTDEDGNAIGDNYVWNETIYNWELFN
jgi:hypothetical protein